MRILAIDPGSRCGWALSDGGKVIGSGTWDLAPQRLRRFEGGGMRYVRLRQFLNEISIVDRVVVEEVRRHMGVDAAHIYGGVLATVTAWCEEQGVAYSALPVKTAKKRFTGNGNASKDDMIAEAKRRGYDVADDNQADALAMLLITMEDGA